MSTNNSTGMFAHLKHDLPASLVVFLVALPLCLGIALASGAPLFSGIIAGIVGGIVVAAISGSSVGVSGPAAGLAVIVLSSIQSLGAFDAFLLAVVIAGVFQIILGIAKAGIIAYFFPSSVIKGMLAGIGIIIFLKQIPHAFGYDADPEGDMDFIQPDGHNTFTELLYAFDNITPGAVLITAVSLTILILWERPIIQKRSFSKLVPGALVAVATGILMNVGFGDTGYFALSHDHEVNIPVADSVSGFLAQFTLPDFSQWQNKEIYFVAITIAIVASLETLLCVEATDKMDPNKGVTPVNRELIAQGVGNTISGLIGGLPLTQVVVRSSANIQSGGRTKMSSILHGFLILTSIIVIPQIVNLIPLASLAAILFVVGYKLAKPSLFKEMYKKGGTVSIPFIVTVLGLVFTDLLIGICLGLVVGIMQILWNNYRMPYHFDPKTYKPGKPVVIKLSQEVTFLNKASIFRTLDEMPNGTHVIIDESINSYIHPDVEEIFEEFAVRAPKRGITFDRFNRDSVFESGSADQVKSTLSR
jgi:MFS superfamily sulfate permease-like transporter